ncbi:MAG: hypothetical protein WA655_10060 [Candidatus Korobacteraceae bacterium]
MAFTTIVQGLAIKPLLHMLGISTAREDAYKLARVQQIAVSSARSELDELLRNHLLSGPAYEQLRQELDEQLEQAKGQVTELYGKDASRILPEIQTAKLRLIEAKRSAIEQAVHDGLINQNTANKMIEAADKELDGITGTE